MLLFYSAITDQCFVQAPFAGKSPKSQIIDTIRLRNETIEELNVDSKAECGQLYLAHVRSQKQK